MWGNKTDFASLSPCNTLFSREVTQIIAKLYGKHQSHPAGKPQISSLLDTGGIIAEVAKLHTLLTEVEVQEHVLKNIPVKAGKY